jgi:hypothetical protein
LLLILSVASDPEQVSIREAHGSIPDRLNRPGHNVGPLAPEEPTHRRDEVSFGDE